MSTRWLDRLELLLIYVLAGFLFWPNAVSSIAIIGLTGLAIVRVKAKIIPTFKEGMLLVPPALVLLAWTLHGSSPKGGPEIQLWATWIAAFIAFRHSSKGDHFPLALVWMSLAQAIYVLVILSVENVSYAFGFSQGIRDAMDLYFHVHPTYVSAVWLWAASWLLVKELWPLRFRILAIGVLVIVAMMVGGKMPFLGFSAVVLVLIFKLVSRWWRRLLLMGGLIGFVVGNIYFNPGLASRFEELRSINVSYDEGQWLSSTELRVGIWNCAWEVGKAHWLTGVGIGNSRDFLDSCYRFYGQQEFFETEYNSHNQYLHFWITGGLLSLVLFPAWLMWLFSLAVKRKDVPLLAFLIYLTLILLTENYFSRQAGMMLVSFVLMQLYFAPRSHQPSSANSGAK